MIAAVILTVVIMWYMFAAMMIRYCGPLRRYIGYDFLRTDIDAFGAWLVSPLLFPLVVVCAATDAAAGSEWCKAIGAWLRGNDD